MIDWTYQSFLKQLNIIEISNCNIVKEMNRNYKEERVYKYYIISNIIPSSSSQCTTRSSATDDTVTPKTNQSNPTHDELCIPITPIDIEPNDNINIISHISNMSMPHNRPLVPKNNLSIPMLDTITPNNNRPLNQTYPTLSKYGIPTDLSTTANISIIQAIFRDLEKLNKYNDLSFPLNNNKTVKPFFIPSSLACSKSFNSWDKGNKGVSAILTYVANGTLNPSTEDPISIEFILNTLSDSYPKSFHNHANTKGYDKPVRMTVVETAAVLSEVGVGDKKIMNTLQKHIKAKFNGHEIFCPHRDLNNLTARLPTMICNNTLFEKESGLKKESIGMTCIDSIQAVSLDMDRYIESKLLYTNIWDPILSDSPLFGNKTPSQDDGTYVLIGTDHGQGTSQFMMRILLGPSNNRRINNRPDFNTRDINYATIKCSKDPYEILKLTMQETNKFIHHLKNHKLIALAGESSLVRCIFVNIKCVHFTIRDHILTATGPGIQQNYQIPTELVGLIRLKLVFNCFHVLQIGDLAAQMALQGREGMASSRCLKCNLTQTEWKEGYGHTLLNKDDLTHTVPNIHIGQKRPMIWDVCPTNTVVPLLHCELGTVNDQLFKKLFRQILSLEIGSSEELDKRTVVLDIKDGLQQLQESKAYMDTDLLMFNYQVSEKRDDLVKKKNNIKGRIRTAKKNVARTGTTHVTTLEASLDIILNDIRIIDEEHASKKRDILSLSKEIIAETKLLEKAESDLKTIQWNQRTKEVSIHTKVERIFEKHGVTIQAYHGGTLTGGAILMLLKKHQVIMDDVSKVCHEYLLSTDTSSQTMTVEALEVMLDEHRTLFQAQDAVYAHLRLIDPTVEEMQETRERIAIMKILWLKMNLSETPKAHLIFSHAADDQERYGGLGDKIEDPLEKRHQEQLRVNAILNKMTGGYKKQRQLQFKYEWRNSNPLVKDRIEVVQSLTVRKRKLDQVSLGVERQNVLTNERHKLRVSNINDIKLTKM